MITSYLVTQQPCHSAETDPSSEGFEKYIKEHTAAMVAIPPLATSPVKDILSIPERELDMTVEEWIRGEMGLQFQYFTTDGERAINLFKEKTLDIQQWIEGL